MLTTSPTAAAPRVHRARTFAGHGLCQQVVSALASRLAVTVLSYTVGRRYLPTVFAVVPLVPPQPSRIDKQPAVKPRHARGVPHASSGHSGRSTRRRSPVLNSRHRDMS